MASGSGLEQLIIHKVDSRLIIFRTIDGDIVCKIVNSNATLFMDVILQFDSIRNLCLEISRLK